MRHGLYILDCELATGEATIRETKALNGDF